MTRKLLIVVAIAMQKLSKAVAAEINETVGRRVVLYYEEHKWIPFSCFGDTGYFITGVRETAESPIQPF